MRSDDAAVCSHGGSSSASSRDSELRFRWGDDVLLLDDVLSLPVSLAADIEEDEDWAVSFTGHPSCGNCIGVNSLCSFGRAQNHARAPEFRLPCLHRVDRVDRGLVSKPPRQPVITYRG